MPTPPKKHRTYCKTCKDFTIHSWTSKDDLTCETCGTVETGYKISEVDENLIEQQRERYKKMRARKFGGLYGAFMTGVGLEAMMELDKLTIVECDAGQKEIDEKLKQIRLKRIEERKAIEKDYNDNYKHLGRNDKCSCGSGKKFKKCHLPIFREKGLKL